MTAARSPAAEYLRFSGWALAAATGAALLGYLPTLHLGGEGALPAMIAGCAVGFLASLAGGVPVALARRSSQPTVRSQAAMASMAVRFGVVLALGLAVALSGLFERGPLLVWIAISYMALLVVDTWYAVKGF
jgi:hypothetical protein